MLELILAVEQDKCMLSQEFVQVCVDHSSCYRASAGGCGAL